MTSPDRKLRTIDCQQPHPDDGPLAMILWRLQNVENMVAPIVEEFHRRSGALEFAKYLGAFAVGCVTVGFLFADHIHLFK